MKINKWKSLKYSVAAKFLIVILVLSSLLLVILPLSLKNFFLEQSYRTIESVVQNRTSDNDDYVIDIYNVNNFDFTVINGNFNLLPQGFALNQDLDAFGQTLAKNYTNQTAEKQRYVYQSKDKTIYYVITKSNSSNIGKVTFVFATYINYMIHTLYEQLIYILLIVVVLSVFIAFILSNSIANPLIVISQKIKSIGKNNWDDPIEVNRHDEIGQIQHSLEEMRQQLKGQDRRQREMFQNISHDLKTPIMIIEGYSQSVLDGYVDPNQLDDTMASIMEEAKRLEKKVKSLLYINKIDQLFAEKIEFKEVDLNQLLNIVIAPFKSQFTNLNFEFDLTPNSYLMGEFDEWRVALENIIDNMTRFALHTIKVTYKEGQLSLFNDGEAIPEQMVQKIFDAYAVGNKSNFGLGLAITKKVVNAFDYEIKAVNLENGVEFQIIRK